MKKKTLPLVLILASVVSTVLLFNVINSKTVPTQKVENTMNPAILDEYVKEQYKKLAAANANLASKLRLWDNDFNTTSSMKSLDSLIVNWNAMNQQALAAYYLEKKAIKSNTKLDLLNAGKKFYTSVRFTPDEKIRPELFSHSIDNLKKVLATDPENLEAQINIAACYVEGSANPMEGITILKNLEKKDSNNVEVQLRLAFFAETSGQWDKAIARFNKILKIDPNNIEMYLHLADAYENKGERENCIIALRTYKERTPDDLTKQEIEKYITKLQTK